MRKSSVSLLEEHRKNKKKTNLLNVNIKRAFYPESNLLFWTFDQVICWSYCQEGSKFSRLLKVSCWKQWTQEANLCTQKKPSSVIHLIPEKKKKKQQEHSVWPEQEVWILSAGRKPIVSCLLLCIKWWVISLRVSDKQRAKDIKEKKRKTKEVEEKCGDENVLQYRLKMLPKLLFIHLCTDRKSNWRNCYHTTQRWTSIQHYSWLSLNTIPLWNHTRLLCCKHWLKRLKSQQVDLKNPHQRTV